MSRDVGKLGDRMQLAAVRGDRLPPERVLEEWLSRVGSSEVDNKMPRYWIWNGVKTYNSYEDYLSD